MIARVKRETEKQVNAPGSDVSKCLEEIKLPMSLYKRATYSDLQPNKRTLVRKFMQASPDVNG